ncbi:MAG: metal ABC transporter permease, partial [Phycisphaerales bacterium]|nr:metal ABC transporter permease [Phycisphaerales bacterium]
MGQGISHAAFGGVGIALIVGLSGASAVSNGGQIAVVLAFSIAAALWIAHLSKHGSGGSDTAIGVVLSVSMAVGFILVQIASARFERLHDGHDHTTQAMGGHEDAHHAIEEVLFGDILMVSWTGAMIAAGAMVVLLASAWWMRRRLMLWGYDEAVCAAFGVDADRTRRFFFVLLAISIVVSMQLAGVVLASAVFVLPGAAALNISGKLRTVFVLSIALAIAGAIGG